MKNHTRPKFTLRPSLALVLALAVWHPVRAQPTAPASAKPMMERCQEMKEQKQKTMAEMKAQDNELTAKVAEMNTAPADKKSDLLAAIVTRMVKQRSAMNEKMGKMQDEMMAHMMEHMQAGKESMAQCPMMKSMGGMGEKSADPHAEHHEEKK